MIVINGKSYESLDEMPPDIRQLYEQTMGILSDKNRNGLPDFLEGKTDATAVQLETGELEFQASQFVFDGKVYTSMDELPGEAQQKYHQAMSKLGLKLLENNPQENISGLLAGVLPDSSSQKRTAAAPQNRLNDTPPQVIYESMPSFGWLKLLLAGIMLAILLVVIGVYSGWLNF